MRKLLTGSLAGLTALGIPAAPLWAHPEQRPHIHPADLIGIVVVALALGVVLLSSSRRRMG